ncbi:hypothetical protein Scep_015891 [Stephania cephalantha]|uniref:Mitochondrial intermembrane space import and assembly protein 40 homolog n=1 Tax=Stephania cephalantha TaxID=152367 RepID=A0AAP0IMS5_9MAGN
MNGSGLDAIIEKSMITNIEGQAFCFLLLRRSQPRYRNRSVNSLKYRAAHVATTGDGAHQNESLDAMAERALQCPCVAELRSGPCGSNFSDAFLCFIKSTSQEKGSDCVHPFVALQKCIKANPNAFSKDVLDNAEGRETEEEVTRETKIIPPSWSREPK